MDLAQRRTVKSRLFPLDDLRIAALACDMNVGRVPCECGPYRGRDLSIYCKRLRDLSPDASCGCAAESLRPMAFLECLDVLVVDASRMAGIGGL